MNYKATIITLLLVILACGVAEVKASCPNHTTEQQELIKQAYYVGLPYDLAYTLSAIVVRESFVGPYIIRVNSGDGKYGSYGVTHIELETAMWLEGYTNSWQAKQDLVPKLISDDHYAMHLALNKLRKDKSKGWMVMWSRYNGSGSKARQYAEGIKKNIKILKDCYDLDKEILYTPYPLL